MIGHKMLNRFSKLNFDELVLWYIYIIILLEQVFIFDL